MDGGGTTTRAVVIDDTHNFVLARAQSGSSNLYNVGLDGALANIAGAVDGALREAGMLVGQMESFGFGLAGAVGEAEVARWTAALARKYGQKVRVDEDVAAALVGAFGPEELASHGGAVLIAGTGANCFGQNASGWRVRADGWGPMLGDRGSGFWLGEAAIRAAVAAIDGVGEPTSLSDALLAHFAVADLNALVAVIYAPDFARERIAAFVPHVLKAARAGDTVASELLEAAAGHLARTAHAVLFPLGGRRLALTGGLLENAPEIRAALAATPELEGVELVAPKYEAVVGAALLGMKG